jgi:hypothetical protein
MKLDSAFACRSDPSEGRKHLAVVQDTFYLFSVCVSASCCPSVPSFVTTQRTTPNNSRLPLFKWPFRTLTDDKRMQMLNTLRYHLRRVSIRRRSDYWLARRRALAKAVTPHIADKPRRTVTSPSDTRRWDCCPLTDLDVERSERQQSRTTRKPSLKDGIVATCFVAQCRALDVRI